MNEREFIENLTDILDCEEELTMETILSEVEEWDSLGVLTFLAEMTDAEGNPLKAGPVKEAKTVADLFAMVA